MAGRKKASSNPGGSSGPEDMEHDGDEFTFTDTTSEEVPQPGTSSTAGVVFTPDDPGSSKMFDISWGHFKAGPSKQTPIWVADTAPPLENIISAVGVNWGVAEYVIARELSLAVTGYSRGFAIECATEDSLMGQNNLAFTRFNAEAIGGILNGAASLVLTFGKMDPQTKAREPKRNIDAIKDKNVVLQTYVKVTEPGPHSWDTNGPSFIRKSQTDGASLISRRVLKEDHPAEAVVTALYTEKVDRFPPIPGQNNTYTVRVPKRVQKQNINQAAEEYHNYSCRFKGCWVKYTQVVIPAGVIQNYCKALKNAIAAASESVPRYQRIEVPGFYDKPQPQAQPSLDEYKVDIKKSMRESIVAVIGGTMTAFTGESRLLDNGAKNDKTTKASLIGQVGRPRQGRKRTVKKKDARNHINSMRNALKGRVGRKGRKAKEAKKEDDETPLTMEVRKKKANGCITKASKTVAENQVLRGCFSALRGLINGAVNEDDFGFCDLIFGKLAKAASDRSQVRALQLAYTSGELMFIGESPALLMAGVMSNVCHKAHFKDVVRKAAFISTHSLTADMYQDRVTMSSTMAAGFLSANPSATVVSAMLGMRPMDSIFPVWNATATNETALRPPEEGSYTVTQPVPSLFPIIAVPAKSILEEKEALTVPVNNIAVSNIGMSGNMTNPSALQNKGDDDLPDQRLLYERTETLLRETSFRTTTEWSYINNPASDPRNECHYTPVVKTTASPDIPAVNPRSFGNRIGFDTRPKKFYLTDKKESCDIYHFVDGAQHHFENAVTLQHELRNVQAGAAVKLGPLASALLADRAPEKLTSDGSTRVVGRKLVQAMPKYKFGVYSATSAVGAIQREVAFTDAQLQEMKDKLAFTIQRGIALQKEVEANIREEAKRKEDDELRRSAKRQKFF